MIGGELTWEHANPRKGDRFYLIQTATHAVNPFSGQLYPLSKPRKIVKATVTRITDTANPNFNRWVLGMGPKGVAEKEFYWSKDEAKAVAIALLRLT